MDSNVAAALRPLTPYPTITVWSRKFFLQRLSRNWWRPRVVSASSVVPTRTIRNSTRSGVMKTMLTSRAVSLNGVMSP